MEAQRTARVSFLKPVLLLLLLCLASFPHELYAHDLAPSISIGSGPMVLMRQSYQIYDIGVVFDMGSWIGKNIHSCITMAISDFYASNGHYKTRMVLHTRDSRGDPRHAMSSGLDLIENIKVQAMLVAPQTAMETKSFATVGSKSKVPIFSFSSIQASPGEYPFLVQINQDETLQFKGIASILKRYKWMTVAVIYEDTDHGKDIIPYLVGSLQESNIRVTYRTAVSPFSTDDQILDELHKLASVQQTIIVVHMSSLLTSRLFLTANRLGMMKEGYAWIVTAKTMNQLQSMDWEVVESMQGVVGMKTYIPSSSKLRDFSLGWNKEFYSKNPTVESGELGVPGIWAYDTIWALAESIEILGHKNLTHAEMRNPRSGVKLLDEFERKRFTGLSGEFQIVDGRLHFEMFEIVNVIGKGERRVGFWTSKDGTVKKIQHKGRSLSGSQRNGLEAIIWPGVTTIAPKGLLMLTSGRKLRIAVPINEGFKQFASLRIDSPTNTTTFSGFCPDVFHAAIDSLDYPVPFEFIPYVDKNGNNLGSLTDLVHQVYLQEYDGIVGDLTITRNRTRYVDFTVTYTDLGTGTITKRDNNDIWFFLKPFRLDLWLTSAAFFVLTGLVVWFIEHSSSNQEFGGSVAHQMGTMLWFGFSTIVYAHREKLTSNLSRLVVIVWLFVVLILTSSYTATLSSMLTLQNIELRSATNYIGIQYNSPLGTATAKNQNFKDDRLREYSSPEEYADALSRGSKKGGVEAIIDEIPYLKIFLEKYGADYAMIATQPNTNGFGFAFQKNYSLLVSDLSQAIIKLREEGTLAMMEAAWFESDKFMPEDSAATPNTLNLRSFSGLFLFSFLCSAFAFLVRLNSILLNNLDYFRNIFMILRNEGILASMLRKIAPRDGQIEMNKPL